MFGTTFNRLLVTSVLLGLLGIGMLSDDLLETTIFITLPEHNISADQPFTVTLKVSATEPVNVFKGVLVFDP